MIGNALGDGKPKDNTTDPKTETFKEKYERELRKDMDDLGLEDIDIDIDPEDLENLELRDEDLIDDVLNLDDLLGGDDDEEDDLLDKLIGGDDEDEVETAT